MASTEVALSSEKYEVLEKIGHGSFGIIRKVRRQRDGLVRIYSKPLLLYYAVSRHDRAAQRLSLLIVTFALLALADPHRQPGSLP